MFEAWLFLLVTLSSLIVALWADPSEGKVLFIFSAPFIFFLGLFPVHFLAGIGAEKGWLTLDSFTLTWRSWFWLTIISLSYSLAFLLTRYIVESRGEIVGRNRLDLSLVNTYSHAKIKLFFYLLSGLAFTAFLLNFNRVGFSVSMMFTAPRKYEVLFGQYWYINYLYFLHVPALIMYALRFYIGNNKFFDHLIAIGLVLISAFHGIKYTVFDALFFPLTFYIALVGFKKIRSLFYFVVFFFLTFFTLFSLFVRGSNSEGLELVLAFLNYLIPNYYNLFYQLESNVFPMTLSTDIFLGYLGSAYAEHRLSMGFILNDKYNMITGAATVLASLSIFGFVIFYTLFNTIYISIRKSSITLLYLKSYILISYLMFFYSYYIGSKYKYIYFFLVFIILDILLRNPSYSYGNEKKDES
ncbi:oligosaccharide repeat unit polymerase [Pseudidiomarina andamanensis]|uniref:Oligosaccharide repeat unit polymerase n=1 Tax=Pseudidiomarina andamanensis TaxID=1940690 RepID=A0AA92EVS8_9GAMM|nr:oligosaccharide repeat unit polymerase [Pseudidiomarina andamanensis]MDS0217737.1 oligosaccharide repeat unit polymerase [Pseudidiomarina andamanensis]QGT96726.1 hypothetical protein D3795_11395 [Pseudidiomarina andamanensis]